MRVNRLHKESISQTLWDILVELMLIPELSCFRLVGGTSLSLQLGHRMSVDIDLFTDAAYSSIDFNRIDDVLIKTFPYVETLYKGSDSFGKSYFIGYNASDIIKVDLFYTDKFIRPYITKENIRLATLEEIAAMKMEVIGHNGRKKDFWDLHEIFEFLSLDDVLNLYIERYPYSYTKEELIVKLNNFSFADDDFNPICLKGKYWELIKSDIFELTHK